MAREEGESSVIVNIPNPTNKEAVVVLKDKDRDIIIDLNNNIMLTRVIKVAVLSKFLGQLEKLEEYLNKVYIYIYYN
jgi:hypothetical protein